MTTPLSLLDLLDRLSQVEPSFCRKCESYSHSQSPNFIYVFGEAFVNASNPNVSMLEAIVTRLKRKVETADLPLTMERGIGGQWYIKITFAGKAFETFQPEEAIAFLDSYVRYSEFKSKVLA